MAHLRVGTSGWVYHSWKGPFYPDTLANRRYLTFYAQEFGTTEINSSFYHLPRPATFTHWAEQVPEDFVLAVKAGRFLTHLKRLLEPDEPWQRFVDSAVNLGRRLGPILHLHDGLDVFVYFNNDADGNTVRNARLLKRLLAAVRGPSAA